MEEGGVKIITISELIQRSRPLTGASSISPSRSISTSSEPQPLESIPKPNPPDQSPSPKIMKALNQATVIIGALTLPSHDKSSTSNSTIRCPQTSCFSFSDGSSTICCDILDLDVRIIGRKIRVIAWNFIPIKCGGGFLEIINWNLPETSNVLSSCSNVFPLVSDSSTDCKDSYKARCSVRGALESVSPVSVVPSSYGVNKSTISRNVCGFLVQLLVCECKLCSVKDCTTALQDQIDGQGSHCFIKPLIVYFCGRASSWHPVIIKLVGSVIFLFGLKKKLVFIGAEDSQLMYVTTEKTSLRLPELLDRWLQVSKNVIKGKGECGMYTGTVTGIYMQGMVVELDKEMLLLLTDRLFALPHSLRVGAIVTMRNVHFVDPKFRWTKILVLGACYKTSISVKSFSPFESGSCVNCQSESLLGKFINSLSFSVRLWVLLLVSSFRKKFAGILTEKDILGSKHKEGLAQSYATLRLPSSVFRSRHGVFREYCKHDSCGCGSEPNYGQLKLVVPISHFISHCEATWMKLLLERETNSGLIDNHNKNSHLSCEGLSYSRSIRRIMHSKDIGVVLLGSVKVRVPLLKKEVELVNTQMEDHKKDWEDRGCSLMCDGWTDRRHRTLLNFLVNCRKGSMFIESIDASSYSKDGEKMYKLLDEFVERIGEQNVVQVATDSAAANVLAGKLLMAKRPHLYWTPCAAHCLDLMLEDIFKLPHLKKTWERAIRVHGYIYNRPSLLNMMRHFTQKKELIKPAKTRFATACLTLQRIHQQKGNLRRMFTSDVWSKSKWAREAEGKRVAEVMLMPSFWNNVLLSLRFACPLLVVLRLVDGEEKPAMGYIYEAMDRAKETIAETFSGDAEKYKDVFEIIDRRWNVQLHQPLHATCFYLNPGFFYKDPTVKTDKEIFNGVMDCIEKLIPCLKTQDGILDDLAIYEQAVGLLGKPMAVRQRTTRTPVDWWLAFGREVPLLQKFAVKVLSLTCSSSGCERNWSVFEHISSSSGRLQLIDATGSIDVIIPDLSSAWNVDSIYEVNDFSLVMEGKPEQVDCFRLHLNNSFLCRYIFSSIPLMREMKLTIYLLFYLGDAKSRNFPFHVGVKNEGNFEELQSGKFHLLLVTHKYPKHQKFEGEQVTSNSSSMFAEAFILLWDLLLAGNDGHKSPTKLSSDLLKESLEHHYASRNYRECASRKRERIDQSSNRDLCSRSSGAEYELCGHKTCCSTSFCMRSCQEQKCLNLRPPPDIPCFVTSNDRCVASSGILCCSKANLKVSSGCKPIAEKILLEFSSESFWKCELLTIGGYYIIKHHKEDILCTTKDGSDLSCGKIVLTTRTHLWSLSFSSDVGLQNTNISRPPTDSFGSTYEALSECHRQNECPLENLNVECPVSHSDLYVHLSSDNASFLNEDLTVWDESLVKPSVSVEEVTNISWCDQTIMSGSHSRISDHELPLSEGNLVSFRGHVVAVHNSGGSSFGAKLQCKSAVDISCTKFFQVTNSVCIHVLVDHHFVKIFGATSKHSYPIGFGPGITASFHRILVLSGRNELFLTPTSFIVIKAIRVDTDQCIDKYDNGLVASGQCSVACLNTFPSALISEIMQCSDSKTVQFHCRVVAIYILVLEDSRKALYPKSRYHSWSSLVDIPLAGFVVDDGSSPCCCWTNSDQAAILLRLHEEFSHETRTRSIEASMIIRADEAFGPIVHQLDKILQKHGRVIIKNYGSLFDSSSQDLSFSTTSNTVFSSPDVDLLKFVILEACFSTFWTVVGTWMDSNAIVKLEKQLMQMEMKMHPMRNIWVREVYYPNPVPEARKIAQELLNL